MFNKMELRFLLLSDPPPSSPGPSQPSSANRNSPSPARLSSSSRSTSSSRQPSAYRSATRHDTDRATAANAMLSLAPSVRNGGRSFSELAPSRTMEDSSSTAAPSPRNPKPTKAVRKAGSQRPRPHKCFCGQSFNKREHLKRHNMLVHQEVRPYSCDVCGLQFGTKQNMQVHFTTRKHRQRAMFSTP